MFAITGITGQVGSSLATELLNRGFPVRGVVRDAGKAVGWAARGCQTALAEMADSAALSAAFSDCEGVFILLPPNFDPAVGFPETRAVVGAVHEALQHARPARAVVLSTIGAQAGRENLLTQLSLLEHGLSDLTLPLTFLRPAWFLDNLQWDIAAARERGVIPAYLQPLERRIPMVAARDVGRVAADLLASPWQGHRVVELEGPAAVSPQDIAEALARRLGRPVRASAVPRGQWEADFRGQGMRNPVPRMQMLDGFNAGWLCFEGTPRRGRVGLDEVLEQLLAADAR